MQYQNAINDFSQAIQQEADIWTRAIALNPREYLYYSQRASAYEQLGKQDLAQKDEAKLKALGYRGPGTPDITGTQSRSFPRRRSYGKCAQLEKS